MSSRPDRHFWQSTGFRWSLTLAIAVWTLSSAIVLGLITIIESSLLDELSAELDEEIIELSELLEQPEYPLELEEFVEQRLEADDLDINFEAIERTQASLWDAYEESDEQDTMLRTQLWLLGESELDPDQSLIDAAKQQVTDMNSSAQTLVNLRTQWLNEQSSWGTQQPMTKLLALLASNEEWDDDRCYVIYQPDESQVLASNLQNYSIEKEIGEVAILAGVRSNSRLGTTSNCLVRHYRLYGQFPTWFGLPDTPIAETLDTLYLIRNWALPLAFLLAILFSALLASRLTGKLNRISLVANNVIAGDLSSRTHIKEPKDDFDQLATAIDQMLDHIEKLMSGIKDVSDNISHDLRTPLTRLRNKIDELSHRQDLKSEDLSALSFEADQLLETFSGLLRISQLEQGSQRRAFEPFDLVQSLHDIHELFEPVFNEHNIKLNLDIATKKQWVTGDRDLWLQVLTNLLENALRYAATSEMVNLHLHLESGVAVVEVKDQGPGIPEQYLNRVLERFFRVDPSRSSKGTGLGLSMVAAICSAMNLQLLLLNDRGLTVKIYWPTH